MRLRIKNTHFTILLIGWLQIIGGVTGIGLMAYIMLRTAEINGAILLILLVGLALYIFSIYAGKRLITDQDKKNAIILSIIHQALQIIQWKIAGYGLSYSSGAELLFGIKGTSLNFDFSMIISTFKMSIDSGDEPYINVNLIAMFILYVLNDILRESKEPKELIEEIQEHH